MKSSGTVNTAHTRRVCHVTSGHEVTDTRIFRRECALLKESGFDVSLMAQYSGDEVLEGIRIHSLPMLGFRWYKRCILLFPILLKILTRRFDLIHFHDPDLLLVMLAYSWLTGRPVVWDAHENYESVIARGNKLKIPALSRMAAKVYSYWELRLCRLAGARVVTVSEPMADRYRDAGLASTFCPNYVDHRRIPFPAETEQANPPLIIMTGALRGEAFETELVEAFSTLRRRINCRLAFFGDIQPALRASLMKKARDFDVEGSVECAGPFPWQQLVTQLIPQSSVAVYIADPNVPQCRNAIPNRIFEYWANGVPVIVANGTLCAELVNRARGGMVVNYGSVRELAKALEVLLGNPNFTRSLGRNGRQAVLGNYNWVTEGSKLIDLYNGILRDRFPEIQTHNGFHTGPEATCRSGDRDTINENCR